MVRFRCICCSNQIGLWWTLSKTLRFKVCSTFDDYNQITEAQMVSNEEEQISYYVQNLDQTPEDAIVDRDLFTAEDYIAAIQLGMDMREKGYTNVSIEWEEKLI